MAIHYYAESDRFRDEHGRFVSYSRAMKSSIAREEYREAQEVEVEEPVPKKVSADDTDEFFEDLWFGDLDEDDLMDVEVEYGVSP